MELDVESHLSAVHRSVAFLERDEQPASAVKLSRDFAATLEDVWDAVTNGDRIPNWFAPVSGDLELGGHYQVEGNAGGTITVCERLSHFDLTWEFAGDVSWVEVRLSGDGDGHARLTLTHTAILSPHWGEFGPGAVGVGWELGLLGLALHMMRILPSQSQTKKPLPPHRRPRRSSQAAARRGGKPQSKRERTPTPREPRQRARPPSTRENQPSLPNTPNVPYACSASPTQASAASLTTSDRLGCACTIVPSSRTVPSSSRFIDSSPSSSVTSGPTR